MDGLRRGFAVALLILVPVAGAGAQEASSLHDGSTLRIAPSLMRSDAATSVGLRWSARQVFDGAVTHDRFPRRFRADLRAEGAAAWDADANPETIQASLSAGWFVALFEPPTDPDPTDPDAVPEGGFDYGSVSIGAAAEFESDQLFDEVNAVLGARVAYVNSRQDFPWPLLPGLRLEFGAVLPLATELSERVDAHTRGDVYAAWHVPLFATPFTAHAELWYWNAFGADDESARVRTLEGLFGSVALAYGFSVPLGQLTLHEVFVRWSGGDAPVRATDRRSWMIGIVVGG